MKGLMVASLFPFLLGVLLLLNMPGEGARHMAMALSAGLHIMSFFSAASIERFGLRQWSGNAGAWGIRASRWALLAPYPAIWIPAFLLLCLTAIGTSWKSLIGDLYSRQTEARRHLTWRQLEIGQASFRARPEGTSRSMKRRIAIYRIAILLLAPEAGLLTWLLAARYLSTPDDQRDLLNAAIVPTLLTAFGLLFLGIFLQGLPPIARWLRWKQERLAPYLEHGVLLLPPSLLLGGCATGLLAFHGEAQSLGGYLKITALVIMMLSVLYLLHGTASDTLSSENVFVLLAAAALSLAINTLGTVLKIDPALAERSVVLLQAIPFLGVFAGLTLGPSLLRPFTWRHILDSRLRRGVRIVLATLALTSILPLGGLAVPFWIWARRRLWPGYERELSSLAR